MPGFAGLLDRDDLFALAGRDDVESRLVLRDGAKWSLAHGPFSRRALRALPARQWTLLVQGVNLHHDEADRLLRRFAFVPFARLDDLMVSYAAPGGGVGPHVDAYDVFLLQGFGRRRWRYGRARDLALKAGLPLKMLRRFRADHDATLAPGDLLYLPPCFAHDGVAIDACTTYSIGFRAAGANELAQAFLDHLRDTLDLPGRYADPGLRPSSEPARIDAAMHRQVARMLAGIRWDRHLIEGSLGTWLTEPKPQVSFAAPQRRLSRGEFGKAVARHGLRLDRRTHLLYDDNALYVNGAAAAFPRAGAKDLVNLANARNLTAGACARLPVPAQTLLHDWYRHGYLHIDTR